MRGGERGRPPLPDVWPTVAAGMAKGDRVVVKGAEESRALRAALAGLKVKYGRKFLLPPMMQRKRGESVKLADGQYVVTQIGPMPFLPICGACAGASCAACTRGRVVGKRSAEQCECRHDRHIPLAGHGRSGYMDTGRSGLSGGVGIGPVESPVETVASVGSVASVAEAAIPGTVQPAADAEIELRRLEAAAAERRAWVRRQMGIEEERMRGGRG